MPSRPRFGRPLPCGVLALLLSASAAHAAPATEAPPAAEPATPNEAVNAAAAPDDDAAGFVPLFNGRDLEGWEGNLDGYDVVEGALHCRPGHGGNVRTVAEYADFILRFEFKLAPGANNGLGIRMPAAGDAAFSGMELQILDDADPKYASIQPWQAHGSIYGVVPAERGCLNPAGEWNTEEVTVQGSRVKVVVNGKTIVDADVAEFRDGKTPTADGKPHPGLGRTQGHIGFLGHGDEVWFRNVMIKSLQAAPPNGD